MKYLTPAVGSINLGQAHQESGIAFCGRAVTSVNSITIVMQSLASLI
jgi:hypothetical protein